MSNYRIIISAVTAAALAAGAWSCGGRTTDNEALPSTVRALIKAVDASDSVAFSRIVSYPLQRPYPLHDITSEAEMQAYYPTLVDDSLRQVIVSSPAESWQEYGWRGWSVADGRYVWVDDDLYDVNYLSQREQHMLDSLVDCEIGTLEPSMRRGWEPVGCMYSDNGNAVFRIDMGRDEKGTTLYRLAVYVSRDDMRGKPYEVLTGYRESEGTAAITSYTFRTKEGATAYYLADIPDGSKPRIEFKNESGSDTTVIVQPGYWLDLLPDQR